MIDEQNQLRQQGCSKNLSVEYETLTSWFVELPTLVEQSKDEQKIVFGQQKDEYHIDRVLVHQEANEDSLVLRGEKDDMHEGVQVEKDDKQDHLFQGIGF